MSARWASFILFLHDKGRSYIECLFSALLVASSSFSFPGLILDYCLKFQDCKKSGTEEEKTTPLPPSQTDVKLFTQDDNEDLFDTVNSPLASFHESERSCQGASDQVSENPLSWT